MDIGKEEETIIIEPIVDPVPRREETPWPEPAEPVTPQPVREPVPA